ncbi:MAG: bifunctional diaminohydroxyphosphoribosylaminopyrimidine deaminase/5-amino-6-(5-phosphoribosylamino)uracil reductase RibD [candidate division KSB1 bacterium]|nr:bifunctional diaminohydroxyphosphoribosylaminopyrimidine deaminase/5-amino-6-(5-phosphoribosylamino)uracil reductase RibD [candidate division KSB1 bacterium]
MDEQQKHNFMRYALRLARRGAGRVSPNPMVGALVVKDGRIIGRGYHRQFGGPHAEVFALEEAGKAAKGATLFVTLEPCCHYGKTSPCTDKIIAAGIKKVIVAMQDPNPEVNGKGLRILQQHGIEVESGILEARAQELNVAFVKFMRQRLPLVTLKIAQTLDGHIADAGNHSKWITGERARRRVHRWRSEAGAVLVGIGTVLADDPQLTVRLVRGPQPWRVVLDTHLRIPLQAKLMTDEWVKKTIIFSSTAADEAKIADIQKRGARVIRLETQEQGELPLRAVLEKLAEWQITHVLVEGGSRIFSAFLQEDLADRLAVFIAPKLFGNGLPAMELTGYSADRPLTLNHVRWRRVGEDVLLTADLPQE